jgi:hypothetical protein
LQAALDAFPVKRRTLFLWKQQRQHASKKLTLLNERSKRPHHLQKRSWPEAILREIERLRTLYPNLSKEKIYPFLFTFCQQRQLRCSKPRTIGRIIADHPHKMRKRPQKLTPSVKFKLRHK